MKWHHSNVNYLELFEYMMYMYVCIYVYMIYYITIYELCVLKVARPYSLTKAL